MPVVGEPPGAADALGTPRAQFSLNDLWIVIAALSIYALGGGLLVGIMFWGLETLVR